jgi:hypothetical protein
MPRPGCGDPGFHGGRSRHARNAPCFTGALEKQTVFHRDYRLSPAGYGIHWPLLGADLSIDGILRAAEAGKERIAAG